MDDEAFAYQLASWLDPYWLMECARRYETDREHAVARVPLVIGSGRLGSGAEANFSKLVTQFLRGFRVPRPLIELTRAARNDLRVTPESWEWLESLTLSARIMECSREDVPDGMPPQTILLIEERDAVLDLIRPPVLALLDLVDMLAQQWRETAKLGASIYHEHNMPSAFYAYVDAQVAAAYVPLADPDFKDIIGPKFRYRAVTVFGSPALEDPIWEMVQDTARRTALTTHQPIRKADP